MNVKQVAINLISEVDKGGYSNIVLNENFKKLNLNRKEKSFVTEIFYGVLRNKTFLDYLITKRVKEIKKEWIRNLLRISFYQIIYMRTDNMGVVWEAVELTKKKYGVPVSKFINATLRKFLLEKDLEIKKLQDEEKYEILYSIPKWFYELLLKQYGKENLYSAITSLKEVPYLSVRVNKLKYTEKEFEEYLEKNDIEIIKKVESLYYINSGLVINSEENDLVLDICSAPGGKTAVLAECMNNKGEIIAIDIHQHKIKLIETNMKKLDVNIVKPIVMDARSVNKQGRKFDKILVDVPCSGYGVIRKKPEILNAKNKENIEELAKLQLEILNSSADILKNGGSLIYSTCTISDEENTLNVEKFLKTRKDFKVEKIEIPENVNGNFDHLGGFCVNYKEKIMDNFYMIKLTKQGE